MKKLLLVLGLILCQSVVQAKNVWISSNTATADTGGTLCGGGRRGIYHGICVNTAASSNITVYNSSFTATGSQSYGVKNGNASGCFYYDVVAPKGLFYVKTGTSDITLLYDCY